MKYSVLLADADGTLFDFHKGEINALVETFSIFNLPVTKEHLDCYHIVNQKQWELLEQGKTTQKALRVDRFSNYLNEMKLKASAEELSSCYIECLSKQKILLPGALEFVKKISKEIPIYLVTNGIAKVQRGRFTDCEISPYISKIFISEEVGEAKPHPAMIKQALSYANVTNKEAILFGDSISADIGAANNAGIDSCLFWQQNKNVPVGHGATYVVNSFEEASKIILTK